MVNQQELIKYKLTGGYKRSKKNNTRAYPIIQAQHSHSNIKNKWFRTDLQVNKVLQEIFKKEKVIDAQGNEHKFIDGVNPIEGKHIYNIVRDNNFKHTLEIGMAMGTSALYICQAMKDSYGLSSDYRHIAVDPNQTSQYKSIGLTSLRRAGLYNYCTLMEEPSYSALPKLLHKQNKGQISKFDLIFIDGWHTFDYTLVDFFYADLLLADYGVILLDDIKHPGPRDVLSYIKNNYPHYKYVENTPCADTLATFIKIGSDIRPWNYHVKF